MTIKLHFRLTAPFVTSRGAVTTWTGWKLRQETINKAHRSVRRHPSTFIQGSKVKTRLTLPSEHCWTRGRNVRAELPRGLRFPTDSPG